MKRQSEFRYSKLAAILREQILSGFIKPGEFLMSENELSKYYEISRTSVRKSLDELAKEGLIIKKPGQGTLVSPDLKIEKNKKKVLRIIATAPSYFVDASMSMLIDRFQESHPNVEIKMMNFPRFTFWDSVRESLEMGLEPDLLLITEQQFQEAAFQMDELINLKDVLGGRTSDVYPKMIQSFMQGEELKALPVTFSPVYLAYNPELFRLHGVEEPAPGWNKQDFIQTAKRLTLDTDHDGIVDLYGFSLTSSTSRWPVIALQNQVHFHENPSASEIEKTLNFIHDLVHRERVATLFQPVRDLKSSAFMNRKSAMVLTTSIELAGWRNLGMDFTPKVAALPFGDHKSTLLVSNVFVLPARSANPDLAQLFLHHIFQADIQQQISIQSNFHSIFHSINEQVWQQHELESLNIIKGNIDNSYFLFELFSDPQQAFELERELELFWAGLENAGDAAVRLHKLFQTNESETVQQQTAYDSRCG